MLDFDFCSSFLCVLTTPSSSTQNKRRVNMKMNIKRGGGEGGMFPDCKLNNYDDLGRGAVNNPTFTTKKKSE